MADLYEQIRAVGTPRDNKADIVEYYQEKYPDTGKRVKEWKQHLVADMLDRLHDVTPATVGKVEYARQAKNLGKRFEQRLNNPEPRKAEEYRDFGETLPTKPPEGGYEISGTIWVKFSDGECEEREIDPPEYITGEQAQALAEAAYEDALRMIVNEYMEEPFDAEEGNGNYAIGDCQPPDLIVSAIE